MRLGLRPPAAVLVLLALGCSKSSAEEIAPANPPEAASADLSAPAAPEAAIAPTPAAPVPAAEPSEPEPPTPTEATFGPAKLTMLDDAERAAFMAGDTDAPIPVDIHYVQSNETRHDLFFPYIEELGGAYVGVGSDQNFTMMAKSRAEYAFLMDIDFRVVDLHRMYDVFIVRAETPEALLAMWDAANEESSIELLRTGLELDDKEVERIVRGYRTARETVFRHLKRVIARDVHGVPASWLSDPELYAHVRSLYQTKRVRIMAGDLTGTQTLQTVGKAVAELRTTVGVLYMSNAEEYFKYGKQFVANIDALPSHDKSMVLRTIYSKKFEHADLWAYQVQSMADFKTRLADRKNRSRNPMFRYAEQDGSLDLQTGKTGFSRLGLGSKAT